MCSVTYSEVAESANHALGETERLPIDAISEGWSFAVPPTHQVFVTGQKPVDNPGGMTQPWSKLFIMEKDGRWWLTYACMEEKGEQIVKLTESIKAKAQRAEWLNGNLSKETKIGFLRIFSQKFEGHPLGEAKKYLERKTG